MGDSGALSLKKGLATRWWELGNVQLDGEELGDSSENHESSNRKVDDATTMRT